MAANQECVIDSEFHVCESDLRKIESDAFLHLVVVVVHLNQQVHVCESACEAHVDHILCDYAGCKTPGARLNDVDWLKENARLLFEFPNFDNLLHEATFDEQVLVGQQTDVLNHASVLELDLAVGLVAVGCKVVEVVGIVTDLREEFIKLHFSFMVDFFMLLVRVLVSSIR